MFQPLDLQDVTAFAGGARSELHRLFTTVYGRSLAGYIRARRLSEAAHMLRDTQMDILSIAFRCQYTSQAAFTRAFSRQFGCPPGRYQRGEGRRYAAVPVPSVADLAHRAQLPRELTFTWRHEDVLVYGAHHNVDPNNTLGFLQAGSHLADETPPDAVAVGLTSTEETPGELAYFLGTTIPQDKPTRTFPAGLYATLRHQGPVERVLETLAYLVQRWPELGLNRPSDGVDAETFPLQSLHRPDLVLTFWLAMSQRPGPPTSIAHL